MSQFQSVTYGPEDRPRGHLRRIDPSWLSIGGCAAADGPRAGEMVLALLIHDGPAPLDIAPRAEGGPIEAVIFETPEAVDRFVEFLVANRRRMWPCR